MKRFAMKRFVLHLSLWHLAFIPAYFSLGAYPPKPLEEPLLGVRSVWGLASAVAAPFLLASVSWLIEQVALRSSHPMMVRAKQTFFLGFVGIALLSLAWLFVDRQFGTLAGELRTFGRSGAGFASFALAGVVMLGLLGFLDAVRRRLARWAVIGAYILAPLALVSAAELLFLIAGYPSGKSGQWPLAAPSNLREDVPLNVVVLLYDELDYEFVFNDGQVVGNLPNFRDLAATSLVMHNVDTAHESTIRSVGELLTGQEIEDVYLDGEDTQLILPGGRSIPWRSQRTLFDLAMAEGYDTAVLGTYYHYCRHFAKSKDGDRLYCRTGGNDRLLASLLSPYQQALASLPTVPRVNAPADSGVAHRRLLKVVDGASGVFAYAHYPMPHLPFRYNPDSMRLELFRTFSYSDNVGWADAVLGEVIQTLRKAGTWDATMLVVTSDHYYRSKPDDGETRIPLFLKLPHMSEGENLDLRWSHRLFLPLMEELYKRSSFDPATVRAVMGSLSCCLRPPPSDVQRVNPGREPDDR